MKKQGLPLPIFVRYNGGVMTTDPNAELSQLLLQYGFCHYRVFDPALVLPLFKSFQWNDHVSKTAMDRLIELSEPVLIAAFPVEVNKKLKPQSPSGRIAPFAQRTYYREAVRRLSLIARSLTGRKSPLAFSNSRLPEKLFAAASGLGYYGKHSLIIIQGDGCLPPLGTRFILAGMVLPGAKLLAKPFPPLSEYAEGCETCEACIASCPTGALKEGGVVDRSRCLQSLATDYRVLPDFALKVWGDLLYGCECCQDSCPYNLQSEPGLPCQSVESVPGLIGPFLSLETILETYLEVKGNLESETMTVPARGFRNLFAGTTLGASFIDPRCFVRNALVIAGNLHAYDLAPLVSSYLSSPDEVLSATAEWAISRLS